jgi:trk system potassium uptake protein
MRAIIVGCGRCGSAMAQALSEAGHDVTIVDVSANAFRRLPNTFAGNAIRGNGTDGDVLRRAGAEGADMFFSLTEGDNRNILAAQLARESFGIERIVAKVNDPVRAEAYRSLGLSVICRTTMMVDALRRFVGLPGDPDAVSVIEPVANPGSLGAGRGAAGGGEAR